MHEIPNFPFTSTQESAQSTLAQQELGVIAELQTTQSEDSQKPIED